MLKYNNFIITESQHRMLTESAAERFVDRLITNNLPENARQYADTTIGELVKSHPDILSHLPLDTSDEVLEKFGNTKLKDFIRISIMRQFDMHGNAGSGKGPVKYMRGIFRIVLDELKLLQRPDMNCINRLKDNVLYIMNAANDGDAECLAVNGDLNGMSEKQVNDRFKDKRKAFFAALRDRVSKREVAETGHTYTKVVINRHADAVPFQPYTEWCIAFTSSSNYDGYVQGGRRFYVFLRDDYKDFQKGAGPVGDNCPLDDYGMSMVSVLVNMDGGIDIITTRWNHAHDGEFNPPDEETLNTIQRLMGVNLFHECSPYSREELRKMGIIPVDELQGALDRGVDPKELFKDIKEGGEGFWRVYANGKWSFLNKETNRLIGDGNVWYEYVYIFHEGHACIQREDEMMSFIDTDGKLIGDDNQWFIKIGDFYDGYAAVEREDGKYSFIDMYHRLIGNRNQWYKDIGFFDEGSADVEREDGKWVYISTNGKEFETPEEAQADSGYRMTEARNRRPQQTISESYTIYKKQEMMTIRDIINEEVENAILRSRVREMVSEEVYGRVNRAMLAEKKEKKKSKKDNEDFSHQVMKLLRQDKINLAAVARKVFPDIDEDAARSMVSKISRGKLKASYNTFLKIYQFINSGQGVKN